MHTQFVRRLNEQSDTFVFRDRLVHIAHFAYEIGKRDFAKTCRSLTFLDFRKAQNGGDDRKRLIDSLYRFVCNHLQLLKCLGAGATALKRKPRTREWRAQVIGFVGAHACKRVDESFHLVEHAVDYHRKCGEGIVGLPMRESFTQVSGDDALYPLLDLNDTLTGTSAQRDTDRKAKKHSGNQTKRHRRTNDARDLLHFIDIPPNHQHVAVRQTSCDQANRLFLPITFVSPVDYSALYRVIDLKIGWQAFQVTRNPATTRTKQSSE